MAKVIGTAQGLQVPTVFNLGLAAELCTLYQAANTPATPVSGIVLMMSAAVDWYIIQDGITVDGGAKPATGYHRVPANVVVYYPLNGLPLLVAGSAVGEISIGVVPQGGGA